MLATRSSRRSACSRSANSSSVSIVSTSASGSTRPLVDHLRVVMRADHVQDRVGLADVRQELVAEALALVRAADQAGDVVELHRLVHHRAGAHRRGDAIEAFVRTPTTAMFGSTVVNG